MEIRTMIQRIQTLYLGLSMLLLAIVSIGTDWFSLTNGEFRYVFSSFGITKYTDGGKFIEQNSMPMFIGLFALILLMFLCIMSYKNLARQFKLGRTVFYLYFLFVVGLLVLTFTGENFVEGEGYKRELGFGFYLFIAGFPFTFLANTGIKRDKNLLDSLDRLR